jgi:hypothetical protein
VQILIALSRVSLCRLLFGSYSVEFSPYYQSFIRLADNMVKFTQWLQNNAAVVL